VLPAVPTVTALHELPNGSVAVEVDGSRWRAFPLDIAARVGLREGTELDRARLRELGRELHRRRGLDVAARLLSLRDLPAQALEGRLERAGVPRHARGEVVETLTRGGLVDDQRFALGRARALAERGYGDEAIRWKLELEGVPEELAGHAVAELEPETERAARAVARRGATSSAAGWLARRGFGADAIESALGSSAGADASP